MEWTKRVRPLLAPAWDGGAWLIAVPITCAFRYDFRLEFVDGFGLLAFSVVAAAMQLAVSSALAVRRGRAWVGSIEEAGNLALVAGLVGVALFVGNLLLSPPWVPRSVPVLAAVVALAVSGAARLAFRAYRQRVARPSGSPGSRVIVFGAGAAGQQLVRSMLREPGSSYLPVAMIDDDPKLWGRRVAGVSVRGGRDVIGEVREAEGADLLVIAVPSASNSTVREVSQLAVDLELGVKVLPPLSELFRPWVGFADVRDLDIADLLGRRQVDTDLAAIAGYLQDRRVLVTGAGGSIGSELCRQIHRFGPAELIMLDRDESALHAVVLSIHGRALLDSPDVILADIRDRDALTGILTQRRPDVVFHAAALKHLPMLEQYPAEAWKTNVIGTLHVMEAARAAGVSTFVNISTDKAANPTSMLGRSKRIGERLVADAADDLSGTYLSVRFGNVLGSRGSVITTFAEQLAAGGPITVTHPDVTRFFMTIPEAVQLVVQAAAIGGPGEALVLDMGRPVRIVDVARQLMSIAGSGTRIVYTGLREGEKLHEELFGDGEEDDRRPLHPAISHVSVPPLGPGPVWEAEASVGPSNALVVLTSAQPQLPAPRGVAVATGPHPATVDRGSP